MSAEQPGRSAQAPQEHLVRSPLSDGEWHRLHPLTPLLRGGLALLFILGLIVANLREQLIELVVPAARWGDSSDEILDMLWEDNSRLLIAGGVLVGLLVILVIVFWVSWRFHTFRITGDDVEVRSGVLFRTHRRAPLDRVQGVNLTRPMIARLLGTAKLEVVGAGVEGNVKLEYLSTANAEAVRGDILRLAAGASLGDARASTASAAPHGAAGAVGAATAAVSEGFTGLIDGVDRDEVPPESILRVPVGRLIASHFLSGATIWLIVMIAGIAIGAALSTEWVLAATIPTLIGFGAYWFSRITRTMRFSVAPVSSGVRVTFGLFTTTTETIPPGRIHAVEVHQPLLWRPFGWWAVRINRLSGRAATDTTMLQFADVLPVGTRADLERVLPLVLPGMPAHEWSTVYEIGVTGSGGNDFTATPRRARWLRPFSWRRNGMLVTPEALFLRKGALWRSLVIAPLARIQSLRLSQGPLYRASRVAKVQGHTVLGPVSVTVGAIDRDEALAGWERARAYAVVAAASDTSHRWGENPVVAPPEPVLVDAGEVAASGVGAPAAADAAVATAAVAAPVVADAAVATPAVATPDEQPPRQPESA